MPNLGLYLHVPFCVSKCPYCDFYSLTRFDDSVLDAYTEALMARLSAAASAPGAAGPADTLYFGGGTPSLLGGARLARLIHHVRSLYGLKDAEITLEANPGDDLVDVLAQFAAAGGNRVSLGMQSANDDELRGLHRRHTVAQVQAAVKAVHAAGIDNFSLDMMLGLEHQTAASVRHSAAYCRELGARHVSAYLLKIEPQTPFARRHLDLPDEDATADLYEAACDALEEQGYTQYEISNFSEYGRQSRHNLKYWQGEPYLGLGPAAHSYVNGRRTYFPRDLASFLSGASPVEEPPDSVIPAGSPEEFLMLRLRLTEGLTEAAFAAQYHKPLPAVWRERANKLPKELVVCDDRGIRLTRKGFLVSNCLINELLG